MKSSTIFVLAALLVSLAICRVYGADTTVPPETETEAPATSPAAPPTAPATPVARLPRKFLVKLKGFTYTNKRTIKYNKKVVNNKKKGNGGVNIYVVGGAPAPIVVQRANRVKRTAVVG